MQLYGALRDPVSGRVLGLEGRPTYLAVDGTGWAIPVTPYEQTLANIASCPQEAVEIDVDGHSWQLELRLEEGARRTTVMRTVTLDCADFDCVCECDAEFPGGTCFEPPVDAGTD